MSNDNQGGYNPNAPQDPYGGQQYPQSAGSPAPYGGQQDPYAGGQQDPYTQQDPYAQAGGQQDPYAQQQYGQQDPYAGGAVAYSGAPGGPARYASWGKRVLGYLIDAILPGFVVGIVTSLFIGTDAFTVINGVMSLLLLGWVVYNRWYLGGSTGQTIGRKVANIKLVSAQDGQAIGMLNAFIRDICHILDSLPIYIGWLFPLWDQERQTFADKIMKTHVIESN